MTMFLSARGRDLSHQPEAPAGIAVSIRAARPGPRLAVSVQGMMIVWFLSARPARGRDLSGTELLMALIKFLSARPARPARGRDASRRGESFSRRCFYPRGPRQVDGNINGRAMMFLSARPARGRDKSTGAVNAG